MKNGDVSTEFGVRVLRIKQSLQDCFPMIEVMKQVQPKHCKGVALEISFGTTNCGWLFRDFNEVTDSQK